MITGSYEKAKNYIESHQSVSSDKNKNTHGPCITISRELGSGGDIVSERVCEFLQQRRINEQVNWAVFDKNLIEKVIEDHNLPGKLREYLEEDKLTEINSMVSELLGLHPPAWLLVHKTAQTILQLATVGNVIIVGRGAYLITAKLNNVFHVRLVAPIAERIKRVEDSFNISHKDAIEVIKDDYRKRKHYLQYHYHKDIEDKFLYHIIINTQLVKYEEAADIISTHVIHKFPQFFRAEH
ncbi:MAG: cytidylate kinase-like family protein [Ignavibacteriaceae bacterium]|nr:cytidylate kinase-like family protein [Ignavibacteriaceae bacterium]